MNVERIEWLDSGMEVGDGWKPIKHLLDDWKCDDMNVISAGLVAYEDEDVVGLSHSHSLSGDTFLSLILIAKKNILKREVLYVDKET